MTSPVLISYEPPYISRTKCLTEPRCYLFGLNVWAMIYRDFVSTCSVEFTDMCILQHSEILEVDCKINFVTLSKIICILI